MPIYIPIIWRLAIAMSLTIVYAQVKSSQVGTPIRHLFVNWTAKFAGFLSHQTDRPTRGGGGRPGATPAAGQGGRAEGRPRRFGGGHAEKTPTPFLRGQKTGLRPEISTNLQYYSMWVRIRHLGVSAVGPQGSICPRSVVLQVSNVL